MNAMEQRFVDALIARSPELAVLISLAREFSSMVRRHRPTCWTDGWMRRRGLPWPDLPAG